MGVHSNYLKGTATTLRRIGNEAAKNFVAADAAVSDVEAADARQQAHDQADLGSKFPALEKR